MEGIKAFLRGEPVAVTAVVAAGIACALAFGFALPVGAELAITGLIAAVSTMFARSKVSPVDEEGEVIEDDGLGEL